jgi:hypothetical protein
MRSVGNWAVLDPALAGRVSRDPVARLYSLTDKANYRDEKSTVTIVPNTLVRRPCLLYEALLEDIIRSH